MSRTVFFIFLAVAMLTGTVLRRNIYKFSILQAVLTACILLFGGIGGSYILGFFEAGYWGNISYYGSVFIVPFLMFPFSVIIKSDYIKLMDYCAPCGIAAIAVGKFHCKVNGCCTGRILSQTASGEAIRFPSQLMEMAVAIVILILLLYLEHKGSHTGRLYPLFLIFYGSTRFILNYFRDAELIFGMIPTAGILSIIAVISGAIWLLILKKKQQYPNQEKHGNQIYKI